MNYEKIGRFILTKRKNLGMTQKDLAEQLGLTDRAVSRWERGLGCPDIGTLEPLANILEVSVLELLHGSEDLENANQVVVTILKEDKKRLNFWRKLCFFCIHVLGIFFFLSFLLLYCIPLYISKNSDYFTYSIVSPSMKPLLNVSDKIVVQKVDISQIQVGDVISFVSNETLSYVVTHRVIDKKTNEEGEIVLKTKGDTNFYEDSYMVKKENFIGILKFRFPKLGNIIPDTPISLWIAFCFLSGIFGTLLFDFLIFFHRRKS